MAQWSGCVVYLSVAVPSHHISTTGAVAVVSHNLTDNIGFFVLASMIISFFVLTALFSVGVFIFVGRVFVEMTPRIGTKDLAADEVCVFQPVS